MIVIFTIFTIMAVFLLQQTTYAISANQVFDGLKFALPAGTVGFAIAAWEFPALLIIALIVSCAAIFMVGFYGVFSLF